VRVLPPPIALPAEAHRQADDLDLHVARDTAGGLTHLHLRSSDGPGPATATWLLDAGTAAREGIDGLRLAPTDAAAFRLRVDVEGSDDLVHWLPVGSGLPLLRVADGPRVIERLDLAFPATRFRYLALSAAPGASGGLPAGTWSAYRETETTATVERSYRLRATGAGAESDAFTYPSVGPLPVRRVAIEVAGANAVQSIDLWRDAEPDRGPFWRGTAWQFDVDGAALRSPAQEVDWPGTGPVTARLSPPSLPPTLLLHYAPARLLVVAAGTPPYRLLAGSGRYRMTPVPMADALAGLQGARGPGWQPPLAPVGPAEAAAGPAALALGPRLPPGQWALWGVLGLGALLVGGLAWRLLRGEGTAAG
jgi:hypothetical protein